MGKQHPIFFPQQVENLFVIFAGRVSFQPTFASLSNESKKIPTPFHLSAAPKTGPSKPCSSVNQIAYEESKSHRSRSTFKAHLFFSVRWNCSYQSISSDAASSCNSKGHFHFPVFKYWFIFCPHWAFLAFQGGCYTDLICTWDGI